MLLEHFKFCRALISSPQRGPAEPHVTGLFVVCVFVYYHDQAVYEVGKNNTYARVPRYDINHTGPICLPTDG
jgi:hypothetical protein